MDFSKRLIRLLRETGLKHTVSTAYDTARAVQLIELGEPIGKQALEWLRTHQLTDGSWGASQPAYFHDRLICTVAAAIALVKYGKNGDKERVQEAKEALETSIRDLAQGASIETIAFEMIAPTLLKEAENLRIIENCRYIQLDRLKRQRMAKLSALPEGIINRHFTLAFSAEMAGTDGLQLLEIDHLQESNGSLGNSPSATAYFAARIDRNNAAALMYLRTIASADGGMPDVAPIDVFEAAWMLWNLSLVENLDEQLLVACQPQLAVLRAAWVPGQGVGPSAQLTPKDSDDTSITFEVLYRFGYPVDIETVLSYEESDYFRCYALEANPSVSANIHVLGALRTAGFDAHHRSVQKVVNFLQSSQYWQDKWHVSPYYATSHAILAVAGYLDWLVEDAVAWIASTQNLDGSWGYYFPTVEETAYCLQALVIWQRYGHDVSLSSLRRGLAWLTAHSDPPYPPLWIGKCLYTPVLVVQATVLSAGLLVAQALGG